MFLDLNLYRREVRVSSDPLIRLSAIDVAPDRPRRTFVFIHGLGGWAEQWQYQLQYFLIENRVVAIDMRGHGLSDRPRTGYDMPQIQRDLENALEVLGVEGKFILAGHSFGGAVVTEYAHAHPDRVEGLVLIATAGQFKIAPVYAFGLLMPDWLQSIASGVLKKRLYAAPHALKALYRDTVATWVGWDMYRKLRVPTLVIRGHRDRVFDPALFEEVARCIPGAEEADIPSSGHLVILERHEAVNRAMERFAAGEEQRSWRDAPSHAPQTEPLTGKKLASRDSLRKERPWLRHYDAGVPYTTAVPHIPLHHLLRSAVRRFPRHPAIFFEGRRISYRELNHQTNKFANALRSMNVGKG
ncbi:MAG: alpha/beta fold hydrolase, partial [Anaerolineae bacterium]